MSFIIIFPIIWYIVGLLSMAYVVKFDLKKIKYQIFLFLTGAAFGFILAILIVLEEIVEGVNKGRK